MLWLVVSERSESIMVGEPWLWGGHSHEDLVPMRTRRGDWLRAVEWNQRPLAEAGKAITTPVFLFYPLKALPSSDPHQKVGTMHSHPESVGDHSAVCFMREVGPPPIFESMVQAKTHPRLD